ncbi:hypothetical protein QWJ39_07110 [Arthrobacter sp. YD4]|uniref:hypothetical protein n=1 Tax=Arthrobacter sp. YD4 TaxID=3058043 RepID=UPI0025B5ACB1|nr:hypothetical protein [Arthrobacter sp. YD4]MDN3936080.1 hypothetical protein [Arthrobacter sp. YD4]
MSTPHRPPVEARVYVPAPGETSDVELMPAGDVTEGVVRVGGTIRRPHQPQSLAVAAYLDWLEDAGFDGSPRFLGRDDQGRDVLTYLPGACAGAEPESWVQSEELLASPWPGWSAGCTGPPPASSRTPTPSRTGRSLFLIPPPLTPAAPPSCATWT